MNDIRLEPADDGVQMARKSGAGRRMRQLAKGADAQNSHPVDGFLLAAFGEAGLMG